MSRECTLLAILISATHHLFLTISKGSSASAVVYWRKVRKTTLPLPELLLSVNGVYHSERSDSIVAPGVQLCLQVCKQRSKVFACHETAQLCSQSVFVVWRGGEERCAPLATPESQNPQTNKLHLIAGFSPSFSLLWGHCLLIISALPPSPPFSSFVVGVGTMGSTCSTVKKSASTSKDAAAKSG